MQRDGPNAYRLRIQIYCFFDKRCNVVLVLRQIIAIFLSLHNEVLVAFPLAVGCLLAAFLCGVPTLVCALVLPGLVARDSDAGMGIVLVCIAAGPEHGGLFGVGPGSFLVYWHGDGCACARIYGAGDFGL